VNELSSHRRHAEAVRAAATGDGGVIDASLRSAVLTRAAGGSTASEPYDALARQIAEAAFRVTDAHVEAVRTAIGSDKGAFEVVMCACIGSGLARWEAAARVIDEARDEAS
jgi:hypothetical protein